MLPGRAVSHNVQVYFSRESIDERWVDVRRIGSIRRVSTATPRGPMLRAVSPVPHAVQPASHADLPIRLPTIPGRRNGHGAGAISRLAKGGQHQCQNHVTGEQGIRHEHVGFPPRARTRFRMRTVHFPNTWVHILTSGAAETSVAPGQTLTSTTAGCPTPTTRVLITAPSKTPPCWRASSGSRRQRRRGSWTSSNSGRRLGRARRTTTCSFRSGQSWTIITEITY